MYSQRIAPTVPPRFRKVGGNGGNGGNVYFLLQSIPLSTI